MKLVNHKNVSRVLSRLPQQQQTNQYHAAAEFLILLFPQRTVNRDSIYDTSAPAFFPSESKLIFYLLTVCFVLADYRTPERVYAAALLRGVSGRLPCDGAHGRESVSSHTDGPGP